MPPRPQVPSLLVVLSLAFALAGCAVYNPPQAAAPRPFRFESDHFAFANETVWNYVGGEIRPESERADAGKPRYARHCFVVARGAVQFWKFARFASSEKPVSDEELAQRVRAVASRDVWKEPLPQSERVVFPGYRNLREFSAAKAGIIEANLGAGWPIYFRPGNYPMIFPTPGGSEARFDGQIRADLALGMPTIVWLYNFPSLSINHAVVLYSARIEAGKTVYKVYDPNYSETPKRLEFDPATERFSYEPTFYFKGGTVTARPVYRGVFE
jgi:hypothetical protein